MSEQLGSLHLNTEASCASYYGFLGTSAVFDSVSFFCSQVLRLPNTDTRIEMTLTAIYTTPGIEFGELSIEPK